MIRMDLLFIAFVFLVIGSALRTCRGDEVKKFSDMFLILFLVVAGFATVIVAGFRIGPGNYLDWWTPVRFLGLFMVFVGIGRLFKSNRRAGRT